MNNCSVIRDLLPLYEDKETSPETAVFVKEHLDTCPECRKYYRHVRRMASAMQNSQGTGHYQYEEVVRKIHKKNMLEGLLSAALLATLCFGIISLSGGVLKNADEEER